MHRLYPKEKSFEWQNKKKYVFQQVISFFFLLLLNCFREDENIYHAATNSDSVIRKHYLV